MFYTISSPERLKTFKAAAVRFQVTQLAHNFLTISVISMTVNRYVNVAVPSLGDETASESLTFHAQFKYYHCLLHLQEARRTRHEIYSPLSSQNSNEVSLRRDQIIQRLNSHIRMLRLSRIYAKYDDSHYGPVHYLAFLKRSRAEGFLFSPLPAASALALFFSSFCRSNFVRMAT